MSTTGNPTGCSGVASACCGSYLVPDVLTATITGCITGSVTLTRLSSESWYGTFPCGASYLTFQFNCNGTSPYKWGLLIRNIAACEPSFAEVAASCPVNATFAGLAIPAACPCGTSCGTIDVVVTE